MAIVYIDTCVYINLYKWETGRNWVHHGEMAKTFIERVASGEFKLVVSDHLEFQLSQFPEYQDFITGIRDAGNLIEVKTEQSDKNAASKAVEDYENTEYDDALHAVLAQKGGAIVLITRNIEHFTCFNENITISFPEGIDLML